MLDELLTNFGLVCMPVSSVTMLTTSFTCAVDESLRAAPTAHILAALARQEGVSTLYRGLVPVIQSLFCSNFVYFYTFHGLKRLVVGQQSAPKDLAMAMLAGEDQTTSRN